MHNTSNDESTEELIVAILTIVLNPLFLMWGWNFAIVPMFHTHTLDFGTAFWAIVVINVVGSAFLYDITKHLKKLAK